MKSKSRAFAFCPWTGHAGRRPSTVTKCERNTDVPPATALQCDLTMPMEGLWYAVWMIMALLAFVILPFALFYYEGDSEWGAFKRTQSALIWTVATRELPAVSSP